MNGEQFEIWFKHLLVDLGISQTKAAEIIGISQQALNAQLKRGTVRFVEVETLLRHFGKSLVAPDASIAELNEATGYNFKKI